jgi:hypothetical protein
LTLVATLKPGRGEGRAGVVSFHVEAGSPRKRKLLDLLLQIEERARLLPVAGQANGLQIERSQRHRRQVKRTSDRARRGERRDPRMGAMSETWSEADY